MFLAWVRFKLLLLTAAIYLVLAWQSWNTQLVLEAVLLKSALFRICMSWFLDF